MTRHKTGSCAWHWWCPLLLDLTASANMSSVDSNSWQKKGMTPCNLVLLNNFSSIAKPASHVVTGNIFRLTHIILLLLGYIKSFIKYTVKPLRKRVAKKSSIKLVLH